jgi:hypothetical protein
MASAAMLRATCSTVAHAPPPIGVLIVERMTRGAIGPLHDSPTIEFGDDPWTKTSPDVLRLCHGLQMCWVHAGADTAEMIDGKASRNRTYIQLVGNAMSVDHAAINKNLAIAVIVVRPDPQPAAVGLLDLLPEAFFHWPRLWSRLRHVGTSL